VIAAPARHQDKIDRLAARMTRRVHLVDGAIETDEVAQAAVS